MTKKFWSDWQKRIGETKEVYRFHDFHTSEDGAHYKGCYDNLLDGGKIEWCFFHKDKVCLRIKRIQPRLFGRHYVYTERIWLHRTDIATIKFNNETNK